MTKTDRDKRLREIAAELKRIRDIPIRELSASASPDAHDDALHRLIMARNMLRAIPSTHSEQETDNG